MIKALSSKIMILVVKAYRYFISPLLGQHCRFHPTCSAYAIEAIQHHGPLRGAWLAAHRLLRCQPFSEGGIDPVPASMTSTNVSPSRVNSQPSLVRDSR